MVRRLLAFALAFVVIAVPLAGDVCVAVCAAGQTIEPSRPVSHHHLDRQSSHHHAQSAAAATAQSIAITPLPHGCGRLEAVVTDSSDPTTSQGVSAAGPVARFTPLVVHVPPVSATDSRHGPPAPIRSASPLRI
jgi:hypothetical protein